MHGENITNMIEYMRKFDGLPADMLFKYYSNYFPPQTLTKFLSNNLKQFVNAPGDTVKKFFNNLDGTIQFKCLLTDLYYRNRHYISSQLNLMEDCARIHAPFLDPDYLKFIISLPPMAFEDKHLYQKMITTTFPEIVHLCNSNSSYPLIFTRKSMVHKIRLGLEVRGDYIFEIPRQLASLKRPRIKPYHWNTFACIEEPYRRVFGDILRGLYEQLEPFFDIRAVDHLFFSNTKENPIAEGFKMRRIYSFALWLKKYFT
jgi:hypothetical protein